MGGCPRMRIFFKIKEGENFNHPREICFAFHRASRNTLSISRIYPPQAHYNLRLTQRLGKIAILGQSPRACAEISVYGGAYENHRKGIKGRTNRTFGVWIQTDPGFLWNTGNKGIELLVDDVEGLIEATKEIGHPLVLKGCSSEIAHKTEKGLIRVDIRNEKEARAVFGEFVANMGTKAGVLF